MIGHNTLMGHVCIYVWTCKAFSHWLIFRYWEETDYLNGIQSLVYRIRQFLIDYIVLNEKFET